ncbi:hypothetical protein OH76DRAFT_372673 [Lentinus brumalis]|uniref:Uncharacterized protein n=1 Tax=Lentinus brumalis TaxID=2498619 RepID=A0A371DEL8_9APHY|nr:hypothetical protein OH76DRAFT_372673 [Polyporus brumalis]
MLHLFPPLSATRARPMPSRFLFLVFLVSIISTTPVPNHIWYGQCIVVLLGMCTVVDTSSPFGIHSSRLVLVTFRIPRYFPQIAFSIPSQLPNHPQPQYLLYRFPSVLLRHPSPWRTSLFRRRIDTPRVRRRRRLLLYLRVVLALFEFVRPAIDVLFCLSLPLYHLQLYVALDSDRRLLIPMSVTFVHTLSYFSTVQHSHHYQMYIVYTIIRLTYLFCLPVLLCFFWASPQSYGDHCFRLLSACRDPVPYTSISAKCDSETGRGQVCSRSRWQQTCTHNWTRQRACQQPNNGYTPTPHFCTQSLVYDVWHICTCAVCVRRALEMVVLRSWWLSAWGRISDGLLPSGFRSEISWLYVLLPTALHCDRAAEVQLSWLIREGDAEGHRTCG